jgi:hypothetical protein
VTVWLDPTGFTSTGGVRTTLVGDTGIGSCSVDVNDSSSEPKRRLPAASSEPMTFMTDLPSSLKAPVGVWIVAS